MEHIFLHKQAQQIFDDICTNSPEEKRCLEQLLQKHPFARDILPDFLHVLSVLVRGFQRRQHLFLCGNGGSFADCIHIAGELMKTFKVQRPIPKAGWAAFADVEFGERLIKYLQEGLPCCVLGSNPSLVSAVQNDNDINALQYAQELYVLGKPGDMLLGISTSGNALNVRYAASTAKAVGMTVIGLTGKQGGKLAEAADVIIKVPETETYMVQEQHVIVYHALCLLLELRFFGNRPLK